MSLSLLVSAFLPIDSENSSKSSKMTNANMKRYKTIHILLSFTSNHTESEREREWKHPVRQRNDRRFHCLQCSDTRKQY